VIVAEGLILFGFIGPALDYLLPWPQYAQRYEFFAALGFGITWVALFLLLAEVDQNLEKD
jgi:hypothetical protein